ncbi:unnamed protein product (macronuclear) [Paramecium tetraurelia]|uniref:Uncharacterized protein n=1 Tax=Paramecium tetraurelia TaxID=5888 RepID=A0CC36_PARTE|nr:uncharacterized protein GSPATT00037137001 [Paramecium tetraurelia]CAK68353.1 unnamed protein product [Paramecium tetraurelia]|eukprot:XP_001435750.1 hypothetical protein (macronuclear) [Paramecium tetraurelia strain d4-2]
MNNSRSSARKGTNNLPVQTGDIEEYIQILYEHQKSCEKAGKYLEADQAKKRLAELKKELDQKNKYEVKDRHTNEKQEIEKAHLDEFNQFNEFWDQKMAEFDSEAQRVKEQVLQRHDEELRQFTEELENSIPVKPKDSAELLSLRKTEESLARQENYQEAHLTQQRILSMERDEYEKWNASRMCKIRNLISQLKLKQTNELGALQQRIISGQEEQRKIRSQELEKLLQKYQNVRKELTSQQNQEITRLDKTMKNQSIMQQSRMNSSKMMNSQMKKGDEENFYIK